MNLNHALIVGELAGNTNFPRPPLCTCSNYRVYSAWIEQGTGGGGEMRGSWRNVKTEKLGGRKERGRRREGVVFSLDARVFSFVKAALSSCRCSLRDERDHLLSLSLSLSRTKYRDWLSQFPPFCESDLSPEACTRCTSIIY